MNSDSESYSTSYHFLTYAAFLMGFDAQVGYTPLRLNQTVKLSGEVLVFFIVNVSL